jgi:transketolase
LRIIPHMTVWRPCDVTETAQAWADAIERRDGPTVLALTRQALPAQTRTAEQVAAIRRGGYVLKDCEGTPDAILIATGSEVGIAVEAARLLQQKGRRVRVVSMPSTSVFDAQDESYRERVLPRQVERRVAVEAAAPETWWRYVGSRGAVVGMNSFGASGVAKDLFKHFGFTPENVVAVVEGVPGEEKRGN